MFPVARVTINSCANCFIKPAFKGSTTPTKARPIKPFTSHSSITTQVKRRVSSTNLSPLHLEIIVEDLKTKTLSSTIRHLALVRTVMILVHHTVSHNVQRERERERERYVHKYV